MLILISFQAKTVDADLKRQKADGIA